MSPQRKSSLLLPLLLMLAAGAFAHEVRPAYLEIDQTGAHSYSVLWKQPTMGEVAVHLVPSLSNGWLERAPTDEYAASGFLIKTWRITSQEVDPLAHRTVSIEGLEQTITDAFVRVRLNDNRTLDAVVRPEHPSLTLQFGPHGTQSATIYLKLGVEHILTGLDHLLFVLGLLLIVPNRWTPDPPRYLIAQGAPSRRPHARPHPRPSRRGRYTPNGRALWPPRTQKPSARPPDATYRCPRPCGTAAGTWWTW